MVAEQAAAAGWAAHYEAAGHPVHFHRLLDHQVAKEALPRRSKVRILAETIKNRCMSVTCIANMRNILNMYNMTNMTNMTYMFHMTNMTNMIDMFNMTNMVNMTDMQKNMTNLNPPPNYIFKYLKYQKYQKYAISKRALPQRVGPF